MVEQGEREFRDLLPVGFNPDEWKARGSQKTLVEMLQDEWERTEWVGPGERAGRVFRDPYSNGLRFFVADGKRNPFYPHVFVFHVANHGTSEDPNEVAESVQRSLDAWLAANDREQAFPKPENGSIKYSLLKDSLIRVSSDPEIISVAKENPEYPFDIEQVIVRRSGSWLWE